MGVPSKIVADKTCSEPDGDDAAMEKRVGSHMKRRGSSKDPKKMTEFIKSKKAVKK